MTTLHFSTFLKLLASSNAERIRNISRYAQPGGFDYWRTFRTGVCNIALDDSTIETARNYVSQNTPDGNRDNCLNKFDKVSAWLNRQQGTYSGNERGIWNSPNNVFSVHIEPEMQITGRAGSRVIAFYPNNAPALSRDTAGSGILLLRRHYGQGCNSQFQIYDVERNKCYKTPTNVSMNLLDTDIQAIEGHFQNLVFSSSS